jgi:hypothetical protein
MSVPSKSNITSLRFFIKNKKGRGLPLPASWALSNN